MDRDKVIKGLELCLGSIDSEGCPEECPYYEACQKYENYAVFQPLMRDALEALKAQKPRVMMLEELEEWHNIPRSLCDPIYVESKITADPGYMIDYNFPVLIDGVKSGAWRCWTSRPTDEQRKTVKWE